MKLTELTEQEMMDIVGGKGDLSYPTGADWLSNGSVYNTTINNPTINNYTIYYPTINNPAISVTVINP